MIIFPDQYAYDDTTSMTFAAPQHTEERSAYMELHDWIKDKLNA